MKGANAAAHDSSENGMDMSAIGSFPTRGIRRCGNCGSLSNREIHESCLPCTHGESSTPFRMVGGERVFLNPTTICEGCEAEHAPEFVNHDGLCEECAEVTNG